MRLDGHLGERQRSAGRVGVGEAGNLERVAGALLDDGLADLGLAREAMRDVVAGERDRLALHGPMRGHEHGAAVLLGHVAHAPQRVEVDGHVAVVYTVTQWPALRGLIADPRLDDPRFATRAGRRQNISALYDILMPWFVDKTRAEIGRLAQAKGVPFGPIFTPAELLANEQYLARSFLAELTHPTAGRLLMPQLPVQWDGRSFAPRPAPPLDPAELAA